jgi:hypothetical protein
MVTPTEDYYSDHDGGKFAPIEATTVATWKARAFLENLAIDALVRIDGDEYRALCVNGEVLQERGRPPRRHCSSCDWSELSPIVIWIVVFCRCDHLISSLLSPHRQLSA